MPIRDEPCWWGALHALRQDQSGVVARWQLVGLGAQPHDMARLRRQRLLTPVHPGVYVDHTGPPTWQQRAWAGVLHLHPAALYGASALRAADGPGRRGADDRVVHVAVDRSRSTPRPAPGLRVHQVARLEESTMWNVGPPRRRYDEAVLDVACDAADDLEAIGVITAAVGSRATTAARLLDCLAARPRVRRRAWLHRVLLDARDGTHSVLEHGYLTRIERPHGLATARRQVVAGGPTGIVYRDAAYEHGDAGAYVELDGALDHASPERRDADLERDLDALVGGRATARLGWRQVFGRACATTVKVSAFLRTRGVELTPRPCGDRCPVGLP